MSGGIGRRLIFIFTVFAILGLVLGEAALAEPAAITEAKTEAEELRERIDDLSHQLDAAVEDYNYAKAKLAETKEAAQQTQLRLSKAEADREIATANLMDRLVEIYKHGDMDILDTLMGSASFADLVEFANLMERLTEQDARIVEQVKSYEQEVTARKAELAQQLQDEKVYAAEAEAARAKVAAQLAANEKALEGKEAQIAQLEAEEAARQARLAEEARRRAEEARKKAAEEAAQKAAEKAAQQAADKAAQKTTTKTTTKTTQKPATLDPTQGVKVSVPESASSGDVVSIAMDYLGCPYVWGGESPSGFDCSGFVMYVYKKVGVGLPHSSRLQYGCGQAVSRGELRPGDLVFFYSPISHVGIYIGDGQMIHAAGTGKNVRINDVWINNYYGACRIIR
ncbi:MAG: C40 family peptidase [Thermoleophilia bacterium]|nr:C40 family peptidase [Thermoleophilia bacterium]